MHMGGVTFFSLIVIAKHGILTWKMGGQNCVKTQLLLLLEISEHHNRLFLTLLSISRNPQIRCPAISSHRCPATASASNLQD